MKSEMKEILVKSSSAVLFDSFPTQYKKYLKVSKYILTYAWQKGLKVCMLKAICNKSNFAILLHFSKQRFLWKKVGHENV